MQFRLACLPILVGANLWCASAAWAQAHGDEGSAQQVEEQERVTAMANDSGEQVEENLISPAGWDALVESLAQLPGQMLARLPEDQRNDPQVQQEIARLALEGLTSVAMDAIGGNPDFPMFLPTIGQIMNVGQPNADTIYRAARIAPDGVYRLSGTRGSLNQAVVGQVVPRNSETGSGRAHLDINALPVDENDRFEIVLSAERPEGYAGEWWEMRPAANRLLLRLVSYDWAEEISPTLSLERIDRPMSNPRASAQVLEQRLRALPVGLGFLAPMFVDHVEQLRQEGFVHRFKSFDITSAGGLEGQFYYETVYDLADDEALIVETPIPESCPYRSIILTNEIYETTDWYNNQASLNGHQAPADSDGMWRVVVSARDPGVRNWLDTSGYPSGVIQGRWTHCSDTPIPSITVVKLDSLDAALPDDVERVTAEQRDAIIRERRSAMVQRPHW